MTKRIFGILALGPKRTSERTPVSPAVPSDAAEGSAHSSADPLAQTDRYRLVVPYSVDPRGLSARRPNARSENQAHSSSP